MLDIKRYWKNPLLTPEMVPRWGCEKTFNPGVIYDGNKFRMLFTAASGEGDMNLGYAESGNGYDFEIRNEPFMAPSTNWNDFDFGVVDDPRITFLENKYYIVYCARSQNNKSYGQGVYRLGPDGRRFQTWSRNHRRVGLAVTEDWLSVKRLGPLSSEHMHDCNTVLFPEKINGKYVYLHRPTAATPWLLPMHYCPAAIWILFTDTISHWSSDRREMPWNMSSGDIPDDYLLIKPEFAWEEFKIGALGVPILTDDGYLMFYHGADRHGIYRMGMLLLDRNDPRLVLCRTPEPIMEPETDFELKGIYPGCIFPSANVVVDNNIFLYYGAADQYVCVANLNLEKALQYVKRWRFGAKRIFHIPMVGKVSC